MSRDLGATGGSLATGDGIYQIAGIRILKSNVLANQYGKSVDELLKQIDRDRQLADEYGVKFAFEPFGGNMEKVEPGIADE